VDRVKDMINVAGSGFPREVEEVLFGHPAVGRVAVLGRPDSVRARWSAPAWSRGPGTCDGGGRRERGGAWVLQGAGRRGFVDELPKGPTGKILKKNLR
jgi:long-chain acyl-CoA synthetase